MGEQTTAVQRAQEPKNELQIVKFETLIGRVDSIFSDIALRAYQIFEGNGRENGHDVEDWFKAERELLSPVNIELSETETAIEIKAEVLGFNEKELEISIEPRQVTITGRHEASKEKKRGGTVHFETMASDIFRAVALPAEVDPAKVTATVQNGVLNITAFKAATSPTIHVQPTAV